MILGQVSWLDCVVFLFFLAPQLIIRVGFFSTLKCGLRALPFLLFQLPFGFIYERFFLRLQDRSPFVQHASSFEDIVIRCVRYAFAQIPASIGRVFFSKAVALPFLRFRMLRHGYLRSPMHWHEVHQGILHGVWIVDDQAKAPDIVVYYAHGGGFSMGSSYFYLEFLLAWLALLKGAGFSNPAIFALEYTLVGTSPTDACYPTQLHQAIAGYNYVLPIAGSQSRICVGGDSAGATLILSLLLHLAQDGKEKVSDRAKVMPGMAVLISPWTTLTSPLHKNTASDYLDATNLTHYAHQYASPTTTKLPMTDPLMSPGDCTSLVWWRAASPKKGFFITYGLEEVFAPEIRKLVNLLRKAGIRASTREAEGGIHAWPVAALFLSSTEEERQKGLRMIVKEIWQRLGGPSAGQV